MTTSDPRLATSVFRPLFSVFRPPPSALRPPAFHFPSSTNAAPSTPSPLDPLIPRRPPAGFSLTEVVIALGIFAVSMVGVLALFPVASATSRESSEETQAAILAQTILDDAVDAANRRGMSNSLVIRGPNTIQTGSWIQLNLNTGTNQFVGYDIKKRSGDPLMGEGMMGDPIALKAMTTVVSPSAYTNGVADAAYLARIEVSTNTGLPQLAQLIVSVEAPGNLPATNRRVYQFSTLVTGP